MPTKPMTAKAMATRARSAVTSLVRSEVRLDSRCTACHDRPVQWPAEWLSRLLAPAVVMTEHTLGSRQPQHVPHAAQGVDQPGLLGVYLAPQHGHVRLDDAGVTAEVVVPDVVQDLHLGKHPVRVAH